MSEKLSTSVNYFAPQTQDSSVPPYGSSETYLMQELIFLSNTGRLSMQQISGYLNFYGLVMGPTKSYEIDEETARIDKGLYTHEEKDIYGKCGEIVGSVSLRTEAGRPHEDMNKRIDDLFTLQKK